MPGTIAARCRWQAGSPVAYSLCRHRPQFQAAAVAEMPPAAFYFPGSQKPRYCCLFFQTESVFIYRHGSGHVAAYWQVTGPAVPACAGEDCRRAAEANRTKFSREYQRGVGRLFRRRSILIAGGSSHTRRHLRKAAAHVAAPGLATRTNGSYIWLRVWAAGCRGLGNGGVLNGAVEEVAKSRRLLLALDAIRLAGKSDSFAATERQ